MATTASTEPYPLSILHKIKQYSQVVLKVQDFQKATVHISTERVLNFLLIMQSSGCILKITDRAHLKMLIWSNKCDQEEDVQSWQTTCPVTSKQTPHLWRPGLGFHFSLLLKRNLAVLSELDVTYFYLAWKIHVGLTMTCFPQYAVPSYLLLIWACKTS